MGIFSDILFGPSKKKKDEEELQRIAQSNSILGNLTGSSAYSREWSRQRKEVVKETKKQERSMRKQWVKEDRQVDRYLEKTKARYERRMKPDKAEFFFGKHERDERRRIQRERERALAEQEREKNEKIRAIARGIKEWK